MLVIMGVSGSGKTTVGAMLAGRLGWHFANITKMRSGRPLDDADRVPWLRAIADQIDRWRAAGQHGVLVCSALKRSYRKIIIGSRPDVRLVYLKGERALIGRRQVARHGHFMPASLLDSQFETLEEPTAKERAITLWIGAPPRSLVDAIIRRIGARPPTLALTPTGSSPGPDRPANFGTQPRARSGSPSPRDAELQAIVRERQMERAGRACEGRRVGRSVIAARGPLRTERALPRRSMRTLERQVAVPTVPPDVPARLAARGTRRCPV